MLRRESDKNEALVNYQDITFGKLLGSGGFGEVYHGTWRHNDIAIKKLLLKNITPESAQEFETESQIMARLRSPNIVQFYGYSITPERCIVMEYCSNGSLFSVLHSNQSLEWSIRVNIALGAAKGLAFLHEERILHRDIKSLNILLTAHFEAKLTDFGLSKLKAETRSHAAATKTNSAVGTLQWMAPELFDPEGVYTEKSDIYSLGVTFWELSSRKIPFEKAINPMLVPMWIGQGKREIIPADCPLVFGRLIQQCWDGDPTKRPDTNVIITQLKKSLEAFSVQRITNAPSPNPSPFHAPSGPQYYSNLVSEDAPKPLVFSSPKLQPAPQIKQASPQAVAAFVRLIAEGEQNKAEVLLQNDATLALLSSDVTDLSGRTFKGITGFQYAVWALDWHMWTMILKYLSKDVAAEQIKAMDKGLWISQHHKSGDWLVQNLLNALQIQIDLLKQSKLDEADAQWYKGVGSSQYLLPIPFVNEYCHPNRPFNPCPEFAVLASLPRMRKTDKGEWFTAIHNGGGLEKKFPVLRYSLGQQPARGPVGAAIAAAWRGFGAPYDFKALHTLLAARLLQRDQLIADLSSSKRYGYN